jgi:hypothetical protein
LTAKKNWAEAYELARSNLDKDGAVADEYYYSMVLKRDSHALLEKILNREELPGYELHLYTQLFRGQFEATERYLKDLERGQLQFKARDKFLGLIQYRSGQLVMAETTISRVLNYRKEHFFSIVSSDLFSTQNLALSMADLLQNTDRKQAAEEYISQVRDQIVLLKRNGARAGYHIPEARLQILEENYPEALASLGKAFEAGEFRRLWFDDPIIRRLDDEPDLIALKNELDEHINAERAKLGWPPADF